MMKKIKLILLSTLILLFCTIGYFYFFLPIPSFHSIQRVKKIEKGKTLIEWNSVTGILDQNFPDYITIKKGNIIDTVCKAHNISDIKLIENKLVIGFYGIPVIYETPIVIHEEILGIRIEVDTTLIE